MHIVPHIPGFRKHCDGEALSFHISKAAHLQAPPSSRPEREQTLAGPLLASTCSSCFCVKGNGRQIVGGLVAAGLPAIECKGRSEGAGVQEQAYAYKCRVQGKTKWMSATRCAGLARVPP